MRRFIDIAENHALPRSLAGINDAYWIRADGGIVPLPTLTHADSYVEWLKENDPAELRKLKHHVNISRERDVSRWARAQGWIRYLIDRIDFRQEMGEAFISTFHYDFLTPTTAHSCLKILRETRAFQPMKVELSNPDRVVSYNEALKYFRSQMKAS